MIELMRRIGNSFSNAPMVGSAMERRQRSSTMRRRRKTKRSFASEPLEARVMLAADLPMEAFSILSALSRGGDRMRAQAGFVSTMDVSTIETSTPAAAASNSDTSAITLDVEQQVRRPAPLAAVAASPTNAIQAASAVLSAGAEGEAGDVEIEVGNETFIIYNTNTGLLRLDTQTPVTTIEIVSESGIFTGNPAQNLGSVFDVDSDTKIFKLTETFENGTPVGFNSLSFGTVGQTGLTESFVRNDLTIRGSVEPSGSLSNDQVQIEVFATNLAGTRIDQVPIGQEFELTAQVRDVRSSTLRTNGNVGVFSAYFDVTWNDALVDSIGVPEFSSAFGTAQSGTVSDGGLDEVGATSSSLSATTDTAQVLFTQRLVATQGGTLTFTLDPADIFPGHETLNFGSTAAINSADIQFDDDFSLTISDTPTAPDLVAFAKALTAAKAVMYGAAWCPHCTAQKERFEDGQAFINFVEVTNPDKSPNAIAAEKGIETYPTWVFDDGSRLEGNKPLQELATAAGIEIPQSNMPFIQPIEDIEMFTTSPYHVPLDGYDPNGGKLTYTVTSDNPAISAEVLSDNSADVSSNNRSLTFDINGYGKMTFRLFDTEAPRAANQIATLAETGEYEDVILHRIIDRFILQGGDPEGTGFGSSDLPDFADQFNFNLQHNRTGVLSMAKSQDDTNNSQFFITERPQRHLDFNHTVFGQLIEGEKNREALSLVPIDEFAKPLTDVVINTATVFNDIENGLLRLSAPAGTTGSANIKVTVTDLEGHKFEETFAVSVTEDTINGAPFLGDLPAEVTTTGTAPITIQMEAFDIEGDTISWAGFAQKPDELDVDVDANGLATISAVEGFVGKSKVTLNIEQVEETFTSDPFDVHVVEVNVLPGAPTIDLLDASDSGSSATDNITNAASLQFEVSGVAVGALVEIVVAGTVVGSTTATGNSVTITTNELTTLGDGNYSVVARQTVNETTSEDSDAIDVVLDQTAPISITSTAPSTATTGELYTYNAEHPTEGSTGTYALSNGPTGATIDATTGVVAWTPVGAQVGSNTFSVVFSDVAGNSTSQSVTVAVVARELMGVRLSVVDSAGQALSAAAVGQSFKIEVYVEDLRGDAGNLAGVFAAYVDVNFDSNLAASGGNITYGNSFVNGQFGTVSTPGLIDDAGATAGADPLGSGEFLLMSIPMVATAAGTLQLTADAADETPLLDSLLNGLTTPVPEGQISFSPTALTIVDQTFAVDDNVQTLEDSQAVLIRVLDNDIPVPSTAVITIDSAADPANGTVTISVDKLTISYTPDPNFQGVDAFTYTIKDDANNEATATVRVTVVDVNDDPTANNDSLTVAEDSSNNVLNVINNDSFAPDAQETLVVLSLGTVANGTATISTDKKSIVYTPAANFNDIEVISYVVSDGRGGTDSANATFTVSEVNDPPVAVADTRTMQEDTVLSINVSDLLANDNAGPNEATQTLSISAVNGATNGSVQLNGNTITFTPTVNFVGAATFKYTLRDNGTTGGRLEAATATGTVTITVANVNDNPVAVNDTAVVQSGVGSITLNVLANDSFAPDTNETLSITAISAGSANGKIEIATGGIAYTPAAGFSGTETFTYTISDGNGGTATATVTTTVQNFVPGGINGYVFNDLNSDGIQGVNEQPLSGVKVSLLGMDDFGNEQRRLVATNAAGFYQFDSLPPGSYTVTQTQPAFTNDGRVDFRNDSLDVVTDKNVFTVKLGAAGTGDTAFNFTEQGLEPKFSIWEALASSGSTGLYTSVSVAEGQQWAQRANGWDGVEIVDIRLNPARTSVSITINENGQERSTSIPTSDTHRIQMIGQQGDTYLIRLRGDRSSFNFG